MFEQFLYIFLAPCFRLNVSLFLSALELLDFDAIEIAIIAVMKKSTTSSHSELPHVSRF